MENRYRMLGKIDPAASLRMVAEAQDEVSARRKHYEYLAARNFSPVAPTP
jgi:hypothetical protein